MHAPKTGDSKHGLPLKQPFQRIATLRDSLQKPPNTPTPPTFHLLKNMCVFYPLLVLKGICPAPDSPRAALEDLVPFTEANWGSFHVSLRESITTGCFFVFFSDFCSGSSPHLQYAFSPCWFQRESITTLFYSPLSVFKGIYQNCLLFDLFLLFLGGGSGGGLEQLEVTLLNEVAKVNLEVATATKKPTGGTPHILVPATAKPLSKHHGAGLTTPQVANKQKHACFCILFRWGVS